MPDARQRSSSPFMALAVTATIGVRSTRRVGFSGAQLPRQLVAVHARHVDVGEHGGVARRRAHAASASTPLSARVGSDPQQLELAHQHLAVHRMIVDHQDARAACRALRARRSPICWRGPQQRRVSGESAGAA